MKKLLVAFLLFLLLCAALPALAETAFSQQDIIDAALTELTVDGERTAESLTDPARYRVIVLHHEEPDRDSLRGESWYVRFDAADKVNDDSYIVALNEDASLRYLDLALCDDALAQCPPVDFAGLLDQYRDRYGDCGSWPVQAWMAFSADMCKGRPTGRNAWRIQHAVFIPEPEQAIGCDEARRLAVLACGDDQLTAWSCVCLLDGDRAIYRLGVSGGQGWQWMVEIDPLTGETLSVTPYDAAVNGWLDCYIPQSLADAVPAAEVFEDPGVRGRAGDPSGNEIRRGVNPHTFNGVDKGLENDHFSLAPEDAVTADAAFDTALQTLADRYGIPAETLQTREISFGYAARPADFGQIPYWQFDFENPEDPLDSYEIMISVRDGEVLYACGPGEGNG